ncbi:MAG TPA: type II secretion system protein [Candidatus Paceibacterota bacterium]
MINTEKRGFTLLELLIVIGILAILGTVTVLVLNPAELFRQARDSQRVENMSSMRSAIGLYTATVSNPDLDFTGALSCSTMCFTGASGVGANCGQLRHATSTKTTTIDTTRESDGNGWIPVNLAAIPGGAPLASLPVDPINDTTYYFSYACDNTNKTFELNANMESTRYSTTGGDDVESNAKDGGDLESIYEIGTDPGLNL